MLESHMQLIPGKEISQQICAELASIVQQASSVPKLHVILASDDPASRTYVQMKTKQAESLGIVVDVHQFSDKAAPIELIDEIKAINSSEPQSGILVQLPLYPTLTKSRAEILNAIHPDQDVDGLTAANADKLGQHAKEMWSALSTDHKIESGFIPATVIAIMECIVYTGTALPGAEVCIVNASDLIGKPLAKLLTALGAAVTVCDEFTVDLASHTQQADILVTATGNPGLIDSGMVKQGAIIVDVTSLRTADGIKGDVVNSPELEEKVSWLTPVPGGVGPLTIACLLRNLVYSTNRS